MAYEYYDPEGEFQLERGGFERMHDAEYGDEIGFGENSLRSEQERMLIRIQMILGDLQGSQYKFDKQAIFQEIKDTPRMEFYNPYAFILALIYRNNNLRIDSFMPFYKAAKQKIGGGNISSPDLLRYIRFVT